MKRTILIGQSITVCLYTLVYLIRTFIIWEFQNPFQWILNLSTYDYGIRGCIFMSFISYNIMLYALFVPLADAIIKPSINKTN